MVLSTLLAPNTGTYNTDTGTKTRLELKKAFFEHELKRYNVQKQALFRAKKFQNVFNNVRQLFIGTNLRSSLPWIFGTGMVIVASPYIMASNINILIIEAKTIQKNMKTIPDKGW
jgi:hypothetical protein